MKFSSDTAECPDNAEICETNLDSLVGKMVRNMRNNHNKKCWKIFFRLLCFSCFYMSALWVIADVLIVSLFTFPILKAAWAIKNGQIFPN